MKTKNINCSQKISEIEGLKLDDVFLPANEEFTLTIDYPLSNAAKFKIKSGKTGMGTAKLIDKICKLYHKVYENEEKYGIWGHSIDDLNLEGIKVNFVKKSITIDIGS